MSGSNTLSTRWLPDLYLSNRHLHEPRTRRRLLMYQSRQSGPDSADPGPAARLSTEVAGGAGGESAGCTPCGGSG